MNKKNIYQIEQILEIASDGDLNTVLTKSLTFALVNEQNVFAHWIECELGGYLEDNQTYLDNPVKVPEYRKVVGFFMDENNIKLQQYYSDVDNINYYYLREGIPELEKWTNSNNMICIQGAQAFKKLSEEFGISITKFVYHSSTISGVLQDVRNKLIKELINIKKKYNIEFSNLSKTDSIKFLCNLHPIVQSCALSHFDSEQFRSSILDTFIKLNNLIKEKSGVVDKDGNSLIDFVFSLNKPILKISDNKDEQLGAMFLFKGAIMYLRNVNAHHLKEYDDPLITLEWLAFASSLFHILDNCEKNQFPS